jgi:hypothetical protein
MNKNDIAIIIPAYYKSSFSSEELTSLKHLNYYLGKYHKYFIIPDNINVDKYRKSGFNYIKFPKYYFTSTKSYNKLLLKETFYKSFIKYKYILIYQLDALVFSDQLLKWCASGYSYISAPWFNSIIAYLSHKKALSSYGGNGGFSLRNVKDSLEVIKYVNKIAKRCTNNSLLQIIWFVVAVILGKSHKIWLNAPADNYPFNEDGFWSLEAPKYLKEYKVAPYKESLQFAFERYPKKCFKNNDNRLPFGCHAWIKYGKTFWNRYLLK